MAISGLALAGGGGGINLHRLLELIQHARAQAPGHGDLSGALAGQHGLQAPGQALLTHDAALWRQRHPYAVAHGHVPSWAQTDNGAGLAAQGVDSQSAGVPAPAPGPSLGLEQPGVPGPGAIPASADGLPTPGGPYPGGVPHGFGPGGAVTGVAPRLRTTNPVGHFGEVQPPGIHPAVAAAHRALLGFS